MAGGSEKSMKERNAWRLSVFIGVNVAAFVAVSLPTWTISQVWDALSAKHAVIPIAPLLTVILNGILSSNAKAVLVFWRWHHPLPGSRAFTELARTDTRIDMEALVARIGPLPTEPAAQNAKWYKLLKANEQDVGVFEAHRVFLLVRDLSGLAFLFLIVFMGGLLVVGASGFRWGYIAGLVAQYVIVSRVAEQYGSRLTCTVLAVEAAKAPPGQGTASH